MRFSRYTRPATLQRRVTMSCCKPSRQRLQTKGCRTEYGSHSQVIRPLSQAPPLQLIPEAVMARVGLVSKMAICLSKEHCTHHSTQAHERSRWRGECCCMG